MSTTIVGHTCYGAIFTGHPRPISRRECVTCTPTLTEPTPFYNPALPDSEQPDYRDEPMRRLCFTCKPMTGLLRDVLSTFTVNPADPTCAYRLRCGHSTIDV